MAEDTQSAVTERPNKVKIVDAGPSRKKILIEIPAETVAEQLGSSLDTLMVEAELPGFRRGRAPRRLVEKRFGGAVRQEAKNQLVASAYSQAIEEHKLRVLGDPVSPEIEKLEVEDGKPLAFEVEIEVLPEFELPSLDGIAIRRPVVEVTDEMVTQEVERLRLHEGRLEPRETPEPGDYLTGHAKMTGPDGKVYLDIMDAVVQVPAPDKQGKGMILGIMVDDFADQLGLPGSGQTATVTTVGPENHETEEIRGVQLTITFAVSRVDRIVPAGVEELVSRFGMADDAQLRDAVRARITQRVMIEQQSLMRQQLARHLIESVQMELPQRVTAQQAARNLARRRLELMHRGVDPQKIEEHMAELRAGSAGTAVAELKLTFILDKAGESLDVRVSEAEINGRIAQMAQTRNERPERLRQELVQRNQLGAVFQQIREHKTMDAILAKAAVTDMAPEEFNKAMAELNTAAGSAAGGGTGAGSAKKAGGNEAGDGGEAEAASDKPAKKTKKKSGKKTDTAQD